MLRHSFLRPVSLRCSPLRVGLYGCGNIGQKRNGSAEVSRFAVALTTAFTKIHLP